MTPTATGTGSSTRTAGLMNLNHYLVVAIAYLFKYRGGWSPGRLTV
jgi:phosphoglucomutase